MKRLNYVILDYAPGHLSYAGLCLHPGRRISYLRPLYTAYRFVRRNVSLFEAFTKMLKGSPTSFKAFTKMKIDSPRPFKAFTEL